MGKSERIASKSLAGVRGRSDGLTVVVVVERIPWMWSWVSVSTRWQWVMSTRR